MGRIIPIIALLGALSACGAGRDVPRLSDVQIDEAQANLAARDTGGGGGFLSGLFNRRAENPDAAIIEAAVSEAAGIGGAAPVETAREPEAAPRRGGLFGLFRGRTTTPEPEAPSNDAVEAGTMLPFGAYARVCDLPRDRRGTRVARLSGHGVYDSIPNSTAARPHYITGFADGCARTFTAAVVVPADAETHEFIRYTARPDRPYSEVDDAYEALKASVCRVGRGRPCGDRIEQLTRQTEFLTIYERFESETSPWAEILLHDGAVLAMDIGTE